MRYSPQPRVNTELAEQHKREIEAINAYIEGLKGTIISIETIQYGQPAPYRDKTEHYRIFCHRPNAFTTNGPALSFITAEEAKAILRMFTGAFKEERGGWDRYLTYLLPVPNPVNMTESEAPHPSRFSTWEAKFCTRFTD
jgi:hypothetical protein